MMSFNAKTFLFRRSLALVGALLLVLLNAGAAYSADVAGTAALLNFAGDASYKVTSPDGNNNYWNNITSGLGGGKNSLITLTDNGGASGTSITLTNTANAATPWSLSISNLNADVHGDTGHGSDATGYSAALTNIWPLTALEDGFKISYGPRLIFRSTFRVWPLATPIRCYYTAMTPRSVLMVCRPTC